MSEAVWIDRKAALTLMKNSRWGQLKRPNASILDFAVPLTTGISGSQRAREKYQLYMEMSLDSFAEDNPESVKTEDEELHYREDALRKFVGTAMRHEIEDEFGPIPSGSV